jgi:hypothetical protein
MNGTPRGKSKIGGGPMKKEISFVLNGNRMEMEVDPC